MKYLWIILLLLTIAVTSLYAGQRPAVTAPRVVDAAGTVIGVVTEISTEGAVIVLEISGILTFALVKTTHVGAFNIGSQALYWQSTDCSGQAYGQTDFSSGPLPFAFPLMEGLTRFGVKNAQEVGQVRTLNSTRPLFPGQGDGCLTFSGSLLTVSAIEVPSTIFDVFVTPYSIEGLRSLP